MSELEKVEEKPTRTGRRRLLGSVPSVRRRHRCRTRRARGVPFIFSVFPPVAETLGGKNVWRVLRRSASFPRVALVLFWAAGGGGGRLTCLPHLLAVRPAQVTSRWALVGPLWISDCRFSQEPSIFGLTSRCTATYVTSRVSQSSSRRGTQWTSRSTRRSAQPTCHVTPSELRIGCGG